MNMYFFKNKILSIVNKPSSNIFFIMCERLQVLFNPLVINFTRDISLLLVQNNFS